MWFHNVISLGYRLDSQLHNNDNKPRVFITPRPVEIDRSSNLLGRQPNNIGKPYPSLIDVKAGKLSQLILNLQKAQRKRSTSNQNKNSKNKQKSKQINCIQKILSIIFVFLHRKLVN